MIINSFLYLLSSVVTRSVPFLLIPVLTNFLSPEEYGYIFLVQLYLAVTLAFIGMNAQIHIPSFYFSDSRYELTENISAIVFLSSISFIFVFFVFFIIYISGFSPIIFSPSWFLLLPFWAYIHQINVIGKSVMRVKKNALLFLGFEFFEAFFSLVLSVFFVAYLYFGWSGRLFGTILPLFFSAILSFIYLVKIGLLSSVVDFSRIGRIAKNSFPLIFHVLASTMIYLGDRVFLEKMVGDRAVGVYSLSYQFGMVIMMVTDSFSKSWSPWISGMISSGRLVKPEEISILIIKYFSIISVFSIIYLGFLSIFLDDFIAPDYIEAWNYIPGIVLSYMFFGLYQLLFPYLAIKRMTLTITKITVLSSIFNLIFNFILIDIFEIYGAVFSTLLSFMLSSFCISFVVLREYRKP